MTLVAAIKYAELQQLHALKKAGVKIWGANHAQDLAEKHAVFSDSVEWHFIGHLQRNKVSKVVPLVTLIHSLDSYRLAAEIDDRAKVSQKQQKVLVEVKLSGEMSKYGISEKELLGLIEQIMELENLKVGGLMTMPPFVPPEEARPYFRRLNRLAQEVRRETGLEMPVLSMGTSQDFEAAIEEGATMVRVGRALFAE